MALTKIQSIVARLSVARDSYQREAGKLWSSGWSRDKEAVIKGRFRKSQNELLCAGLRELAGNNTLELRELPIERSAEIAFVITVPAQGTFGTQTAKILNDARYGHSTHGEGKFDVEANPSDNQCIRGEMMLGSYLANIAMNHCNLSPDEALDPITPAEMAAFAFPGGLLERHSREEPDLGR